MSTTSTNFTVEDLVAKYINFVEEKSKDIERYSFLGPDEAEKQLLITLYNAVAGEEADPKVSESLSRQANFFFKDVLSSDEFSFLCDNFREVSFTCFCRLEEKDYEKYSDSEKELINLSFSVICT